MATSVCKGMEKSVLDTQIAFRLCSFHISSGLQKPEIVGLGPPASLMAKIQRLTIAAHNPEADGYVRLLMRGQAHFWLVMG